MMSLIMTQILANGALGLRAPGCAVFSVLEHYAEVGCDRLMCLMQMGAVSQKDVMQSIRLTGEELIPRLAS